MNLTFKNITHDFADIKKVIELNNEAFPKEQRKDIKTFIKYTENEYTDFFAIYDNADFIGYILLSLRQPIVYICFFAISKDFRSKGYGSTVLNLLKEKYKGFQIVLDLERTDEICNNIEQRKSRKDFYLKNGFYETGYKLSYDNLSFEILCSEKTFNRDGFIDLIAHTKESEERPSIEKK